MAQARDLVKQLHHPVRALAALDHPRRILGIDQHDVAARRLDVRNAVLDELCGLGRIEIAQHRIGADLPDHEIRLLVDHGPLQPLHHFRRILAAAPALTTVMSAVGYCRLNCAASRFG